MYGGKFAFQNRLGYNRLIRFLVGYFFAKVIIVIAFGELQLLLYL